MGIKITVEGPMAHGKTKFIIKYILPAIKEEKKTVVYADKKSTKRGIEAALEKYDFVIVEKTIKEDK